MSPMRRDERPSATARFQPVRNREYVCITVTLLKKNSVMLGARRCVRRRSRQRLPPQKPPSEVVAQEIHPMSTRMYQASRTPPLPEGPMGRMEWVWLVL